MIRNNFLTSGRSNPSGMKLSLTLHYRLSPSAGTAQNALSIRSTAIKYITTYLLTSGRSDPSIRMLSRTLHWRPWSSAGKAFNISPTYDATTSIVLTWPVLRSHWKAFIIAFFPILEMSGASGITLSTELPWNSWTFPGRNEVMWWLHQIIRCTYSIIISLYLVLNDTLSWWYPYFRTVGDIGSYAFAYTPLKTVIFGG